MKTMMKLSLGVCFTIAALAASGDALAAGAAMDASELPAKTRASLEADIAKARAETPDLFRQAYEVAARANATDARARRPGIPLTMDFKALGPRALMPMLEMLVVDAHAPRDLTPTASRALRLGLIEAVGLVRDARAVPVLARVVEKATTQADDLSAAHVAADALGRIGSDDAYAALTAALAASDKAGTTEKSQAILAGIGSCRRADAARLLAKRLDGHPDDRTAKVLAKALGTVGNAWAWQTLSARGEEAATRETAARALVRAFVAYEGEAREAAAKAFLVVDDPRAATMISDARASAPRGAQLALDDLAKRLAQNPTR